MDSSGTYYDQDALEAKWAADKNDQLQKQQEFQAKGQRVRAAFQTFGLHKGQSQAEVKQILARLGFRNNIGYSDNPIWACSGKWENGYFNTTCYSGRKGKDGLVLIFEEGQRVRDSDTGGISEVRTDKLILARYSLESIGVTYNASSPPGSEYEFLP